MKRYQVLKNFLFIIGVIFLGGSLFAQSIPYRQIKPEAAKLMLEKDKTAILLDVRTPEEYASAHIAGSVLVPDYDLPQRAAKALADKNTVIIVYCRSGNRSRVSAQWLIKQGYTNVFDLGGIISWPFGTVSGS